MTKKDELTKEYGEIVVRTAINCLIDVGAKNFTEDKDRGGNEAIGVDGES